MKFSLTIMSAIAALASATPLATRQEAAVSVEAPEDHSLIAGDLLEVQFENLRFFEHANFGGQGITVSGANNVCSNLVGFWNDRASSIQNQGGSTCIVYIDANCNGNTLVFPPRTQFSTLPSGWNDRASSYKCF
ncbi:hypothetical protein B0O99DRAFT_384089 [Bisporella sp. PMI_857]|nr:hypothetical protein B0O99DRAFT_384089 [Bisporella sp. PMI_857]